MTSSRKPTATFRKAFRAPAGNGQHPHHAARQPRHRPDHALDEQIQPEQDRGFRKAGLDDFPAVGDLALAAGDFFAVDQLDQHRDVRALDQIEQVGPHDPGEAAHDGKADQPAEEGRPGPESRVAQSADGPADSRPDGGQDQEGERHPDIDRQPQQQERQRADHKPHRSAQ
jgi:hypothetical protein